MFTRIIISGLVQGVGFRYFIWKHATNLEVKGWVRNINDGNVEAVFAGEKANVEQMISHCRKGPDLAQVMDISVEEWKDRKALKAFQIL